MPDEIHGTDLFEIIRTTRSMRRLKPDPVRHERIRKNPGGARRKHAALALPGNPRPEGQGDSRGLVQASLGRAGCPTVSVW
jgi:hypothetical protein